MPFYLQFWIIFGAAFLIALAITPVTVWLAPRIGVMDIPKDERRIHKTPIPRFGGLAIFIGITVAVIMIVLLFGDKENIFRSLDQNKVLKVVIVGIFVYTLGIIDDVVRLAPRIKLIGQFAAAFAMYFLGVRVQIISIFGGNEEGAVATVVSLILTIVWIVGITNTVNLVDGVDGLAAGISVIASFCISYVAYINGWYLACLLMLAIAGAGLGFLPFNFYPAKTFMGDGGSLFLGFCLASFSIIQPVKSATLVALLIPVFVLSLPIIDTAFAIVRRLINKKPIMGADKGHIHHRLMKAGMGQRRTVLTLYGISAVMGIAAILFSRELYVEAFGLMAVAFAFIYIVLTDANHWVPKVKEEEKKSLEDNK